MCISEIRKTPLPRKFLKSVKIDWKQGNANENFLTERICCHDNNKCKLLNVTENGKYPLSWQQ
jgi:hypothetical protein